MLSMTGFGNAAGEVDGWRVNVDIRSVNHRFLDVQFKIPDDFRKIEGALRDLITAKVVRGKVECRIQLHQLADDSAVGLAVNEVMLDKLALVNADWVQRYPALKALGVGELLRFPGVLASEDGLRADVYDLVKQLVEQALGEFVDSRAREGKKLDEHLLSRLDSMLTVVDGLIVAFPDLLAAHMQKVRHRLTEAVGNIDENNLQQEFALFMQKSDVDEEFSRLKGHITEVRRIVNAGKSGVGKRLDFLMQELNREANTLGSKAIAAECSQASVELKVLIEQMREQVQNIE